MSKRKEARATRAGRTSVNLVKGLLNITGGSALRFVIGASKQTNDLAIQPLVKIAKAKLDETEAVSVEQAESDLDAMLVEADGNPEVAEAVAEAKQHVQLAINKAKEGTEVNDS